MTKVILIILGVIVGLYVGFLVVMKLGVVVMNAIAQILSTIYPQKSEPKAEPKSKDYIRNSDIANLPENIDDWTEDDHDLSLRHLIQISESGGTRSLTRDEKYYAYDLYKKNGGDNIEDWEPAERVKAIEWIHTDIPLSAFPDSTHREPISEDVWQKVKSMFESYDRVIQSRIESAKRAKEEGEQGA